MHCLICAYIGFIFTRAEHKCSVSERVIQGPLPSRVIYDIFAVFLTDRATRRESRVLISTDRNGGR
jgi:hypothetical protein